MKRVDTKEEVECFLAKAFDILKDKDFNINKNFCFIKKRSCYEVNNQYTNESTMIELDYQTKDVVNELLTLRVENYMETVIDNKPERVIPFYCFIKKINEKQVYIKFKISEVKEKQVLCVSFHFVEYFVSDCKLPYLV